MEFRFHHTALSVSDLEASKTFYSQLGFEPAMDWIDPSGSPKISHMALGPVLLELFSFAGCRPAPESADRLETDLPRIGSKHFALQVDSIEEAKRFVESMGWATDVAVVEGKTGVRYFFVSDPRRDPG